MESTSTPSSMSTLSILTGKPKRLRTLLNMPEHMDLSQIELIYRAEGNANLVLALPQFKKVLRLPKMQIPVEQHQQPKGQQDQVQKQQKQTQQQQNRQPDNLNKEQKQLQTTSALTDYEAGDLTMRDFIAYIQLIRQLVGPAHIFDVDVVAIPEETDRRWINEHIKHCRPAQRLDKEFCGQFGLLLTDATQLPPTFNILLSNLQPKAKLTGDIYAVEIKPKQGWLLPSDVNDLFDLQHAGTAATTTMITTSTELIPTASAAGAAFSGKKLSEKTECRCRYCAMQYLKLKEGKISKRNEYCPMDLFSGITARMLNALRALLVCPQNNLRIFRNGNLIYGDHPHSLTLSELHAEIFKSNSVQLIEQLLVNCLLRDYTNTQAEFMCKTENVVSVKAVVVGQPHSSATLSEKDTRRVEIVKDAEETIKEQNETSRVTDAKSPTAVKELTIELNEPEMPCLPKDCILQKVLQLQLLAKRNLRFMLEKGYKSRTTKSYTILNGLLRKDAPLDLANLAPAEQYLLGATALDCSIMITFQEVVGAADMACDTCCVHLPEYEKLFLTKVTLLDLDPKPDSHFSKYVKQTEAINAAVQLEGTS